ncbi:MAG: hypothetical protein ACRCZD_00565 [Phycicoccus sp.]
MTDSAFRHGISEADILHAYTNAVRLIEIEQYGEDRLIVIGPDRAGNWLERWRCLPTRPTASSTQIGFVRSSTTS